MGSYVIGAKSLAVAKQYTQALSRAARQGFSSGVVPQERRSLTYASGSGKAVVTDSEYQGMFKLSVVEKQEENATNYYLNVAWPESNYTDKTVVGVIDHNIVRWYDDELVVSDADVYLDPYSLKIYIVQEGDYFVSQWILLGNYSSQNHAVTQIVKTETGGLSYSGYTGQFRIKVTDSVVNISGGIVSVNNVGYDVPAYETSLPTSQSIRYYIRHTVSNTATSGDEDPDLSDSEKETLRTQIAEYDTQIESYTQTINTYNDKLNELLDDRDSFYVDLNMERASYEDIMASLAHNRDLKIASADLKINALSKDDPQYVEKMLEYEKEKTDAEEYYLHYAEVNKNNLEEAESTLYSKIESINPEINSQRNLITNTQTLKEKVINNKNKACLQLYGIIPSESKCEIVELTDAPSSTQTDQYLYILLGMVSFPSSEPNKISVSQVYVGGVLNYYRLGTGCEGVLS